MMKKPDDNHYLQIKASGVEVTARGPLAIYALYVLVFAALTFGLVLGWWNFLAAWP